MEPTMHPDTSVAAEANKLVYGDRNKSYQHPAIDYDCTAKLWSAILGHDVTAYQAALCMVAVKLSRAARNVGHRDSLVDICGYATCADEIAQAGGKVPEFVKKQFKVGARVKGTSGLRAGDFGTLTAWKGVQAADGDLWEVFFDGAVFPNETNWIEYQSNLELI